MTSSTLAQDGTPTYLSVTRTQNNNRRLKDQTVVPDGFRFAFEEVPVLVQAFRRMVRSQEFDICEMALTTYLCAKQHGKPFTALPIFLVRGFHHGAIKVRAEGPRLEPAELEGGRVGVNRGYTVTTGVWARSILQAEHGVDLSKVTWVLSGDEHVAEYQPPANVVPARSGADLVEDLLAGELDAVIGVESDDPRLVPLLPDPAAAGYAALRDRGLFPINHLVVVKDELLAAHPDLGQQVFAAFAESKRLYVEELRAGTVPEPTGVDRMHEKVMSITGADPLPYGLEPNRAVLEELVEHAVTQRILQRPVALEDVFAAGTHDLVG